MTADLRAARLDLTNAQLVVLFATPVELIPAPGAGLVSVPLMAVARLVRGTTAYDASRNLVLNYATDTINLLGAVTILFANSPGGVLDQLFHVRRSTSYTGANNFNPSNRAINVTLDADISLGGVNDLLRLNVLYQVVPAAAMGY